jgi:hypothetical protein
MKYFLLATTILFQNVIADDEGGDWRKEKIRNYRRNVAPKLSVSNNNPSSPSETGEKDQAPTETANAPQPVVREIAFPSGKPLPTKATQFISEKTGDSPVLVLVEWTSPKCRHADFRLRVQLQEGKVLARDSKSDHGLVVYGEGYELSIVASKHLLATSNYTMFSHEEGHATFYLLDLDNENAAGNWRVVHEKDFARQANADTRTVQQIPNFRVN